MYECGKLKKVIGNKFSFPVILEQCAISSPEQKYLSPYAMRYPVLAEKSGTP